MINPPVRRSAGALIAAFVFINVGWSAEPTRTIAQAGKAAAPTSGKSGASRPSAKGPLPDPALLDGSALQAEKRPEHGMIGDFELPGDDNSRSGKAGGPPGQPGRGGQQQQQDPSISVSIPGLPMPLPSSGGAGGAPTPPSGLNLPDPTKQGSQGGAQGGQDSAGAIPPAGGEQGAAGGQQAGGPQSPGGASGGPAGKPEGMQVGGLQGEAGAGGENSGGQQSKPSPVSIGDSAMRIEPSSNPAASGGQNQQVAGQTQQHEKGTGSGGKGTGGAGSGNKVEKGRVIPAGL